MISLLPASSAHEAVGKVAVECYGKLLAYIASRFGDITAAEDALSNAFAAALTNWPERGVPANPEAWLLASARNAWLDETRRNRVRERYSSHLMAMLADAPDQSPFPDERLKLMFVCAHPAIDAAIRTPLILQVVLKLDAAQIADAYVVTPAAMGQRLSRAKAKIKEARIGFTVPEAAELPARLQAVLEAVYAAYGIGWDDLSARSHGLADEALWLARTLAALLPDEPEVHGMHALLLHTDARRKARRHADGSFVPLLLQDTLLWNKTAQEEAERELFAAYNLQCQRGEPLPGPFQLEAAIQSAHASRAKTGETPVRQIASLYDALVAVRPSLGALVGRAAAHGEAYGAGQGLVALELTVKFKSRFDYQPYWACRAKLMGDAARLAEARESYARAIALASDPATRRYLQQQREQLNVQTSVSK